MSRTTQVTTETAAYARVLLHKLGQDEALVVGSAASGVTSPLPPHIASLLRDVLASLAAGHDVVVTENLNELTPNEAAEFLNVSRTFVLKLMDEGTLPFRTVGSYRRIPHADLVVYKNEQYQRSRKAMDQLYELDRKLGIDDYNPSPDENPLVDQRS
jgi:excisionase family DNA binding protein